MKQYTPFKTPIFIRPTVIIHILVPPSSSRASLTIGERLKKTRLCIRFYLLRLPLCQHLYKEVTKKSSNIDQLLVYFLIYLQPIYRYRYIHMYLVHALIFYLMKTAVIHLAYLKKSWRDSERAREVRRRRVIIFILLSLLVGNQSPAKIFYPIYCRFFNCFCFVLNLFTAFFFKYKFSFCWRQGNFSFI